MIASGCGAAVGSSRRGAALERAAASSWARSLFAVCTILSVSAMKVEKSTVMSGVELPFPVVFFVGVVVSRPLRMSRIPYCSISISLGEGRMSVHIELGI